MHEINNPLTVIIANAQILARELAHDEDKLELVKLIELAGNRATQVVQNLLGFTRKREVRFQTGQHQRHHSRCHDALAAQTALTIGTFAVRAKR